MSSRVRAFAFVLAAAAVAHQAAAAELRSGTLQLDPSKTLIEFRLPGSLHTTHGTFKLERGTVTGDLNTGKAAGAIVVDASSGDSGIGARDSRMKDSILEAQKYPEITFTPEHVTGGLASDGQFRAELSGILTLHGAGHQITMDVRGQLSGDSLAATSHFSVPYVAWGLGDPSWVFLTVAKEVEIYVATAGYVVWRDKPAARGLTK